MPSSPLYSRRMLTDRWRAIRDAVAKIKREDAKVTVIHAAVGGITANDLMLADASNSIV